jgi:signal peptidase
MATTAKPRSRGARVGSIAGSVLMLAVLLLSVAYVVPSLLGYQRYIITGGSMTGTYDKGSVVFEQVVPSSELKVGDVITYLPPQSSGVTNLVTHRLVRAHAGQDGRTVYRTKGDFNPSKDPWTFTLDHAEQPVVRFHVPYIGWFFLFLADPHHRMLLIGIPAGIVALLSIGEAANNVRKAKRPGSRPTTVTVAH